MQIKAILFDLDNTLYPSKVIYDGGLHAIFEFLKSEKLFLWTWEEFYDKNCQVRKELELLYKDFPLSNERFIRFKKLLTACSVSYNVVFLKKIYDIYFSFLREHIVCEDWAINLLEFIKQKKLKLGIVSNGNTCHKIETLEVLGISQYFDTIVGTDMLGIGKPNPEPFLEVMHDLQVNKDEVIYVWDSPINDILWANNLGIKTVWFDRKEKEMPENIIPTYVIHQLIEFQSIIEHMI